MNAPQRKVKSAPKPLHHTPIDWFRVLQIIRLNLGTDLPTAKADIVTPGLLGYLICMLLLKLVLTY
jgi:hypothetical protein